MFMGLGVPINRLNNIIRDVGLVLSVDAASYTSGTTWYDLSGNNNNITLYGSPPRNSGNGGNLRFNGVNQYGVITNPALLPSGNKMSIVAWTFGTSATTGHFISAMISSNRTFNLHLPYSDSVTYWDSGFSSGYDRMSISTPGAGYTGWHQWVFTKNAITGTMNIYNNNSLLATASGKTKTIPVSDFCNLATDNPADAASFWPGYIGKLQMYNREFSAADVTADFNSNKSRFGL